MDPLLKTGVTVVGVCPNKTSAPAVILSRVVYKTDRALCVCKYRHCCCRTALMRPATRLRLVCNTNIRLIEVNAWLEKLLLSVVTSSCDDFARLLIILSLQWPGIR